MSNLKSQIRDIKLKIISGEYDLSFSDIMIKRHNTELKFISENFKNDVITGSLALKLYGLLDRNIGDVDIIIDDKDRYDGYYGTGLYGVVEIDKRLGYKDFKYKTGFFSRKKYQVDFFESDGNINYKELEFNGIKLKIHNPLDIIKQKSELDSTKHIKDTRHIFNVINLVY